MAQWLRASDALTEDRSSDPCTHFGQLLAASNPRSRESDALSWIPQVPTHVKILIQICARK